MIKKRDVILIFALSLITISIYVLAIGTEGEYKQDPTVTLPETTGITSGNGIEATDLGGGKYQFSGTFEKGGVSYTGDGVIVDSNGNILNFDTLTVDGNHFENGVNFVRNSPGNYQLDHADYLDDGVRKVVKGDFIQGSGSEFSVQSGETINEFGISSSVTDYTSTPDSFSVESAKAVVVDNVFVSDIGPSDIEMDANKLQHAFITSAKDRNTFTLFNGDVLVNLDDGDTIDVEKVGDRYDIVLDSANGNITDYSNKVACVTISPGSRYISDREFSVYIQPEAENFRLCTRISPSERFSSNCSSCGVIDFVESKAQMNGMFEFEEYS